MQDTNRPQPATMAQECERFRLPNGMEIVHQNKGETEFVYREIFEDHSYLRHGIELAGAKCVFDVGANIGLFSLYVNRIAPQATIYAFEPLPRIYEALRINKQLCGMDNLHALPYGLASAAGVDTFTYYPQLSIVSGRLANIEEDREVVQTYMLNRVGEAGGNATLAGPMVAQLVNKQFSCESVVCELRTLSDVISEHRVEQIDLLKIDVEKSEVDVLMGISAGDWPKIRQAVIEVYDSKGQLQRVCTLLEQQGFRVAVEQDSLLAGTKVYMIYASRKARRPILHVRRKSEIKN